MLTESNRRRIPAGSVLTAGGVVLLAGVLGAPVAAQGPAPGRQGEAYELACAPRAVRTVPTDPVRLQGASLAERSLFGPGDTLLLNRGSDQGLEVGQQYFVRRSVTSLEYLAGSKEPWVQVHTAGWLRIAEVHPKSARAAVVHACDAFESNDYLEPFELPVVPEAMNPPGQPDFTTPGHVLVVDERRVMAGTRSFVVVDRGSDHGLKPGQRLTVFRRVGEETIDRIGEATVMIVLPESATVRVDRSTQVIFTGDLVAFHR